MDETQQDLDTESSGFTDFSWTPKGFLVLSIVTMLVVGALSWLFVNSPIQVGAGIAEDVRAAYWSASIAAGIGLAGALVAIVLARRSQQTSLEVLRLEKRAERRELDALVRTEAISTAEVLRELGDTGFAFIAAWAPIQRDIRPQLVKNWLLGPTAPNQDVSFDHLTTGYTPSKRVQELALEASKRLTEVVDKVLATPAALTAIRIWLQQNENGVENSEVRDDLMQLRSWLVNNLRDFPPSELIGVSAIVSDSLAPTIRDSFATAAWTEEAIKQRNAMAGQVVFVGTLIARHLDDAGVMTPGVAMLSQLFSFVPDRESLKKALTDHFLENAVLDALNRRAVEDSVDRVLKSGGVGQHLLAPHSAAMSVCADVGAIAAQSTVNLSSPAVNYEVLEEVLHSSIRLVNQAADKVKLANMLQDKRLQLEALSDRYRGSAFLARFNGPQDSATIQEAMWNDIWVLGQRAYIDRGVARQVFQDIARTAWMLSHPIVPHDGDKVASKLTAAAKEQNLTLQRDIKGRIRAVANTPVENSSIARVAQLFAVVLDEPRLSWRAMTEVLADLQDEREYMPPVRYRNIHDLILDVAHASHPHLNGHFDDAVGYKDGE